MPPTPRGSGGGGGGDGGEGGGGGASSASAAAASAEHSTSRDMTLILTELPPPQHGRGARCTRVLTASGGAAGVASGLSGLAQAEEKAAAPEPGGHDIQSCRRRGAGAQAHA